MTKFVFFFLLHIIGAEAFSQKPAHPDLANLHQPLRSKAKSQKIAGTIIFVTGLPIVVITGVAKSLATNSRAQGLTTGLFVGSLVYTASGLYLLIRAKQNSSRSLSLGLNGSLQPMGFMTAQKNFIRIPAVQLILHL